MQAITAKLLTATMECSSVHDSGVMVINGITSLMKKAGDDAEKREAVMADFRDNPNLWGSAIEANTPAARQLPKKTLDSLAAAKAGLDPAVQTPGASPVQTQGKPSKAAAQAANGQDKGARAAGPIAEAAKTQKPSRQAKAA